MNVGGARWARLGALTGGGAIVAALATVAFIGGVGRGPLRKQTLETQPVTGTATNAMKQETASTRIMVMIETDPPGANVTLGGKSLGPSPARADVERGEHTFIVSKDGFQPEEVRLDVSREAGDSVSRLVRLQPKPEKDHEPRVTSAPSRRYVPPPVRRPPPPPTAAEPESTGRAPGPATISTPTPPPAKVRVITDDDTAKVKPVAD